MSHVTKLIPKKRLSLIKLFSIALICCISLGFTMEAWGGRVGKITAQQEKQLMYKIVSSLLASSNPEEVRKLLDAIGTEDLSQKEIYVRVLSSGGHSIDMSVVQALRMKIPSISRELTDVELEFTEKKVLTATTIEKNLPNIITTLIIIDAYVKSSEMDKANGEAGKANIKMAEASNIFNSFISSENPLAKKFLQQGDLHGFNYGAAFLATKYKIENAKDGESITLIVGKGIHSKIGSHSQDGLSVVHQGVKKCLIENFNVDSNFGNNFDSEAKNRGRVKIKISQRGGNGASSSSGRPGLLSLTIVPTAAAEENTKPISEDENSGDDDSGASGVSLFPGRFKPEGKPHRPSDDPLRYGLNLNREEIKFRERDHDGHKEKPKVTPSVHTKNKSAGKSPQHNDSGSGNSETRRKIEQKFLSYLSRKDNKKEKDSQNSSSSSSTTTVAVSSAPASTTTVATVPIPEPAVILTPLPSPPITASSTTAITTTTAAAIPEPVAAQPAAAAAPPVTKSSEAGDTRRDKREKRRQQRMQQDQQKNEAVNTSESAAGPVSGKDRAKCPKGREESLMKKGTKSLGSVSTSFCLEIPSSVERGTSDHTLKGYLIQLVLLGEAKECNFDKIHEFLTRVNNNGKKEQAIKVFYDWIEEVNGAIITRAGKQKDLNGLIIARSIILHYMMAQQENYDEVKKIFLAAKKHGLVIKIEDDVTAKFLIIAKRTRHQDDAFSIVNGLPEVIPLKKLISSSPSLSTITSSSSVEYSTGSGSSSSTTKAAQLAAKSKDEIVGCLRGDNEGDDLFSKIFLDLTEKLNNKNKALATKEIENILLALAYAQSEFIKQGIIHKFVGHAAEDKEKTKIAIDALKMLLDEIRTCKPNGGYIYGIRNIIVGYMLGLAGTNKGGYDKNDYLRVKEIFLMAEKYGHVCRKQLINITMFFLEVAKKAGCSEDANGIVAKLPDKYSVFINYPKIDYYGVNCSPPSSSSSSFSSSSSSSESSSSSSSSSSSNAKSNASLESQINDMEKSKIAESGSIGTLENQVEFQKPDGSFEAQKLINRLRSILSRQIDPAAGEEINKIIESLGEADLNKEEQETFAVLKELLARNEKLKPLDDYSNPAIEFDKTTSVIVPERFPNKIITEDYSGPAISLDTTTINIINPKTFAGGNFVRGGFLSAGSCGL